MNAMTAHSEAGLALRGAVRVDLALSVALALAVNSLAARFIARPGYPDAYYYFNGAKQMARGQGLVEPYLWNYLGPNLLAHADDHRWPGNLYWMPLTSIVAAPFVALAETAAGQPLDNDVLFRAAQAPLVLLASLLPGLAYALAWQMTGHRRHALLAAALTLFSPFYFVYWANTDAFAVHGVAAAGSLAAATWAGDARHGRAWALAAGLGAGLAHLARADGLLVLLVVMAWLVGTAGARRTAWPKVLLAATGYALVMLPWFIRTWAVTGGAVAGGLQAAWLADYDELFNYGRPLTLAHFLAQGIPAILRAKWAALLANLTTLGAVQGGLVAFPFILAGLWRLRRQALVQIAVLYEGVLLAVMTLVFTLPGVRGGLFHSGAALLPCFCAVAGWGLDGAVEAASRRLRGWRPEQSKPIFALLLCGVAVLLTLAIFWARVVGPDWRQPSWGRRDALYAEAAGWLETNAAGTPVVAVNNPPGWYYFTGWPSIVIPNGGRSDLLRAMDDFGAGWVLLDANYPQGLATVYQAADSQPGLSLRAQFDDGSGRPAYLFERAALP